MSEKQKRLWKITVLTVFELLIMIVVCTANAGAMRLGSGGERVASLQKKLKQYGEYAGAVNGIYDFETEKALKKLFPECRGTADGDVIASLGLNRGENGFSSADEILARYIKYAADKPFSEMCGIFEKYRPSQLMRNDENFMILLKKTEPDSENYDVVIKINKST